MKTTVRYHRRLAEPRGFVLITAMWIAIALSAVVLVLCREMLVESLTVRQHLAQAKVDAAELGVEQYVMSIVEQELLTPGYKDQVGWQQRQIGECYFWVLTPNVDDETLPMYGLTDEASKVDINYATEVMLEYLPMLDQNPSIAAAIVDWRDADDIVTTNMNTGSVGQETSYYLATFGYRAKNAPFETLDELRLVAGLTAYDQPAGDFYLFGADTNHNTVVETNEGANVDPGMTFQTTMRGFMPYVTVYGYQATNPPALTTTTDSLGNVTVGAPVPPTTLDGITYLTPIDVNALIGTNGTADNATLSLLQGLLNQYVPAKANAIMTATRTRVAPTGRNPPAPTPFASIWDWIVTVSATSQLNSTDLSTPTADGVTPLYNLLTCLPPAATTTTTTTTTAITPTATNPTGAPPTTQFAKLNVNTASREALMCLPGFEQMDAENIITYRESYLVNQDPYQVPNISWLLDVVDPQKLAPTGVAAELQAGSWITGSSTVFSADIVTVSQDGRAFKRVFIVVDASSGTPVIIYRRDLADAGWPMDPYIRTALRKGEPLDMATTSGGSNGATAAGRLTFGGN